MSPLSDTNEEAFNSKPKTSSSSVLTGGGSGMRIIVPLQGVVQGRGGLVLGSVIPCALFYFLQLYLKRNRSYSDTDSPSASPASSPPTSSGDLTNLSRSHSRTVLSPRGSSGPVLVSTRASNILRGESAYHLGMRKCREDEYDSRTNPDGIIQLGLAENKVMANQVFFNLLLQFYAWDF